eukprot:180237-Rhodomonas_salina.2
MSATASAPLRYSRSHDSETTQHLSFRDLDDKNKLRNRFSHNDSPQNGKEREGDDKGRQIPEIPRRKSLPGTESPSAWKDREEREADRELKSSLADKVASTFCLLRAKDFRC